MEPVRLFHLAPSHFCENARKVLDIKSIPYELVRVPYLDHAELIRETGQDYTPALKTADGEVVTYDRIADWAEAKVPEPTLYPDGSRELCRILNHWAHMVVEDATWKYVSSRSPEFFDDEEERWRFVEFQERKWGPLEGMEVRRPQFLEGVLAVCRLAEDQLGEKAFLLGDEPSLADCAVYGALHPLYFIGEGLPKEFERLAPWRERVDAL